MAKAGSFGFRRSSAPPLLSIDGSGDSASIDVGKGLGGNKIDAENWVEFPALYGDRIYSDHQYRIRKSTVTNCDGPRPHAQPGNIRIGSVRSFGSPNGAFELDLSYCSSQRRRQHDVGAGP